MNRDQLIAQMHHNDLMPTIVGLADSTHYVIGGEDVDGTFYPLKDDNQKTMKSACLNQAKEELRRLGLEQATLELITPYDEMIGNDETSHKVRQSIQL